MGSGVVPQGALSSTQPLSFSTARISASVSPTSWYNGVTMVLQWCYNGVTMVLRWCYNGFMMVLRWCYDGVIMVLQWCYNGVTMVLWWCYDGVITVLQWLSQWISWSSTIVENCRISCLTWVTTGRKTMGGGRHTVWYPAVPASWYLGLQICLIPKVRGMLINSTILRV